MRVFYGYLVYFLVLFLYFPNAHSSEVLLDNSKNEAQKPKARGQKNRVRPKSNLPKYYQIQSKRAHHSDGGKIIIAQSKSHKIPNWILPGKIFGAKILHSVLAFPDERVPVVALLNQKSARLLGLARLEPNSKRIFIEFSSITISGVTYPISAKALTYLGSPGFSGKYYSKEFSLFGADFISNFVAAYFEGLRPKATNLLGQEIDTNSVDSAVKSGLSSGALSSAERFKEKLKKVPEFSELLGPRPIKVLIQNNLPSKN